MNNEIRKRIEECKPQILEDLATLVTIPSVWDTAHQQPFAPFGENIRKAMDAFLKIGQREGFEIHDDKGYACHIEYTKGEEYIGILGHLDVVSAGNPDLWHSYPFQLTQKGDMLYGRGVNDDKGPLLAAFYALKIVKDMQIPLKYGIRVIAGGAEETTWECMEHYFQSHRQPIMGFSPDGNFPIVNGEKGILQYRKKYPAQLKKKRNIILDIWCKDERGFVCEEVTLVLEETDPLELQRYLSDQAVLRLDEGKAFITYQGTRSLSRNPQRGDNALWHLANDFENFPFAQMGMNQLLCDLHSHYTDFYGKKLGVYQKDLEMGETSLCAMSITYTEDTFYLNADYRYPKSIKIEEMMGKMGEVEVLKNRKPLYVPTDSPLIRSLQQAYEEVIGEKAETLTKGGASYARVLEQGVAFGATFEGEMPNPHMPNETMPFSSLLKACEIYVHALIQLAGAK